ncbi:MAG TPA: TauD/TfdA family dioxygenase, partial [Hyphomicrobiaceae bacterium]|nr:TauD/TfdA family dioxygenase [Hyphomicrobiaceae bacterium]
MPISFRQVGPCFAAEVDGIDIAKPLTPAEVAAIHRGMDQYAVLIFRRQPIDDAQQLAFTRSLGEIEEAIATGLRKPHEQRLPNTFADVSNLDKDNKPFARDDRRRLFSLGNQLWHSDSSFKVVPAKYSLLHARSVVSKGGNTEFADMRAAYDALSDAQRAVVDPLVVEHDIFWSRGVIGFSNFEPGDRETYPPSRQPLVRTHPGSNRKCLYLSAHASHIVGMPVPEGRLLLRDLDEHATQRQFVYSHKWAVGDLVIWDNRCTMHRGRPHEEMAPRDLRR